MPSLQSSVTPVSPDKASTTAVVSTTTAADHTVGSFLDKPPTTTAARPPPRAGAGADDELASLLGSDNNVRCDDGCITPVMAVPYLGYVSYQEGAHQEENAALVELLGTPSVMVRKEHLLHHRLWIATSASPVS